MAFYFLSGRRIHYFHCNIKILLSLLPVLIIVNAFMCVLLYTKSHFVVVESEDIGSHLFPDPDNLEILNSTKNSRKCDVFENVGSPSELIELLKPPERLEEGVLEELPKKYNVSPGGFWKPTKCISPFRVAIIVPYRDRLPNVRGFLAHMHPFMTRQNLEYRIMVVEQAPGRPFNKGRLFNVGFREMEKLGNVSCYIFHDVDLIPLNPRNIYACTYMVRHMAANIDIFNYQVPYHSIFGGAFSIRKSQYSAVNGFSNSFFGWGGEDDDFFHRITKDKEKILRFSPDISQYVMLNHKKQTPSADRFYFLETGEARYCTDGLNSVKYTLLKVDLLPLYTRILVDV